MYYMYIIRDWRRRGRRGDGVARDSPGPRDSPAFFSVCGYRRDGESNCVRARGIPGSGTGHRRRWSGGTSEQGTVTTTTRLQNITLSSSRSSLLPETVLLPFSPSARAQRPARNGFTVGQTPTSLPAHASHNTYVVLLAARRPHVLPRDRVSRSYRSAIQALAEVDYDGKTVVLNSFSPPKT